MNKKSKAKLVKLNGIHYTPVDLSKFVANSIVSNLKVKKKNNLIDILEPSIGDGELLFALLKKLEKKKFLNISCTAFDTDLNAIKSSKLRLEREFPKIEFIFKHEDFLEYVLNFGENNLFHPDKKRFDISIANPPYVRTQNLGVVKTQLLRSKFQLSGRVDLYYAFIKGIAILLKKDGLCGIIVSNKFMTIKSGIEIRKSIFDDYKILHIWDLGDTKIFQAAILPAVLLLQKGSQYNLKKAKFTSIYSTDEKSKKKKHRNIIQALRAEGNVLLSSGFFRVKQGKLSISNDNDNIWTIETPLSKEFLSTVTSNTYHTFGEVANIKVGIKTTADKIYVRSDWNDLPEEKRPEVLKSIITHHVAQRYKVKAEVDLKKILYTHEIIDNSQVSIDLKKYPKTEKYLLDYKTKLESRDYIVKSGKRWYDIHVPQKLLELEKVKLICRDISDEPIFFIDFSKSLVNGDCFWITLKNSNDLNLLWLMLGVSNSDFIKDFYDHKFNNKLYSGRRRYITQYIKHFPIPDPNSVYSKSIVDLTKQIYNSLPTQGNSVLQNKIDLEVKKAFRII